MDTTARVLRLLQHLHERRFWTGAELSEALGVTPRCVRRDVQRLRDLGYPVEASPGVGGGYALGAGEDLPPLPLTSDEAVAVAVGLRAAATGSVRGLGDASLSALAKLERVLPKTLRRRLSDMATTAVGLPPTQDGVDAHVLMSLAAACRDSTGVELDYAPPRRASSHRRLHPVGLVHAEVRWYVVAWDLDRRDWRTFRVDRIQRDSVRPTTRLAPREPPDTDLASWVTRRLTTDAYTHRVRVRLAAPADAIRRQIGPYGAVVADGPDACWLDTSGDDHDRIAPWLAMLGCDILEVEPPQMREALHRLGARLLRAGTESM